MMALKDWIQGWSVGQYVVTTIGSLVVGWFFAANISHSDAQMFVVGAFLTIWIWLPIGFIWFERQKPPSPPA
jgi:hypothetical protein